MAKPSLKADAEFLQHTDLHRDQILHLQCSDLHRDSQFKHRRKTEAFREQLTDILVELQPQIILPASQTGNEFILKESANARVLPTLRYLVLIPNSTFEAKDYRDDVYFAKRSKCVSKVAKHLSSNLQRFSTPVVSIAWRYWKQDRRKREILLTTAKFRFVVQLGMESLDWIQPPVRLVPNRNNMSKESPDSNSVHYNFCLTEDSMHEYDIDVAEEYPNALPTMTLIQIWALQRGFWRGAMDVDDSKALLLYAYRTKRANSRMTPLQVLTVVWKLLAEEESWVRVIPSQECSELQTVVNCALSQRYAQLSQYSPLTDNDAPTLIDLWKDQSDHFPVVLLDSSLRHNFCARWRHHWLSIRHEAMISLKQSSDFRGMFLETRRFWTRHDAYLRINWKDGHKMTRATDDFLSTLRKALGNRVVDMQVWSTGNGPICVSGDSDEIPSFHIDLKSPVSETHLILGLTVDSTAIDFVDRGPPMEDTKGVSAFRNLWGNKAELRRFKDGAIIYAVVWEALKDSLSNSNGWQAEIVERIVQHIVKTHFADDTKGTPSFVWKDIVSVVDGIVCADNEDGNELLARNSMAAHRSVLNAFDELSTILREKTAKTVRDGDEFRSPLGLPLSIDAVEPLGPALRYAELFPPLPHPLLGGETNGSTKKVSGAVSFNPIKVQIRFGSSSKWPNDLKAIGAAKTAMLIELTRGLEQLREFKKAPTSVVTPTHADICFKGYVWRVVVRADPELKLLRSLANPSDEAVSTLTKLTRNAVVAASHHTMVHAVYTSNPSSSAVVRLAKRWLSSHLIQIPPVALELMVCSLYERSRKPGTVFRGFERWLNLLITFDWAKEPLVVDPQVHLTTDDRSRIRMDFDEARGVSHDKGPPLYIVSPCDRVIVDESTDKPRTSWMPYFTIEDHFEQVLLCRTIALARRTHDFMLQSLRDFEDSSWPTIFTESPDAFRAYSALLRVDSPFLVDVETSSTAKRLGSKPTDSEKCTSYSKTMKALEQGPKALRRTLYRNLPSSQTKVLLEWDPMYEATGLLRSKLGDHALFLYNDLCPEVVAVVWRQHCHSARSFSAVISECTRPTEGDMTVFNARDCLREIKSILGGLISDIKVFDYGPVTAMGVNRENRTMKRARSDSSSNEEDDSETEETDLV